MRRTVRNLVLLAVVSLAFVGCASIPSKASSNDCLVVIKTEFINPDNLPRGRELTFNFTGGYAPSLVGQYSWDYCLVVVREPGVILQSIGTQVQAGYRGRDGQPTANLPVPYEPGKIVVAEYVFVHKIVQTEMHGQTSSLEFRRITAQEKDDLTRVLDADNRFASWRE
jgi:hypothetical protein